MYRLVIMSALIISFLISPLKAAEEEESLPSMELLEFLADWSVDDSEWVDPVELGKMNLPEQEHKEDDKK